MPNPEPVRNCQAEEAQRIVTTAAYRGRNLIQLRNVTARIPTSLCTDATTSGDEVGGVNPE